MRLRKRCSDSPSHVTSGRQQARRIAADRCQRRSQLVAEAREEAALELLRAAQRRGLLAGPLGLLALVGEAQRVRRVLEQRGRVSRRRPARPNARAARSAPREPGTSPPGSDVVAAAQRSRARPSRRADREQPPATSTSRRRGRALGRRRPSTTARPPEARPAVCAQQRDLVGLESVHRACSTTRRPSLSGTGPASVSSTSWIVSSTRLRAVTSPSSPSRSIALAAWLRTAVTRSSSSRRGCPGATRNTLITPISPLPPITGTAHELPTAAEAAKPRHGPSGRSSARHGRRSCARPPPPARRVRRPRRMEAQTTPATARPGGRADRDPQHPPVNEVDRSALGVRRAGERREDHRQARGRVGRREPVGEALQAAELPPRRGVRALAGDQRDDLLRVRFRGEHVSDDRPCRRTTMRSASRNI